MRRYSFVYGLVVMVFLLAACVSGGPAQATAPGVQLTTPAESSTPVIVLRRSGGFDGKTLEWQVFVNGLVVSREGQAQAVQTQVPAQSVNELLTWLEGSGFFSANVPTPNPDETCCDRYLYELTVTANGRSNTVIVLDSPENLPAGLADAFQRVAALLGVSL